MRPLRAVLVYQYQWDPRGRLRMTQHRAQYRVCSQDLASIIHVSDWGEASLGATLLD